MSIEALIERVEKAEGADREIDWALAQAFDPELAQRVQDTYEGYKAECIRNGLWPKRKGACWREALFAVPRYTGSMDAAIALVEKLGFSLCGWEGGRWFIRKPLGEHVARQYGGPKHDNITLALISALLHSLSDRGRT